MSSKLFNMADRQVCQSTWAALPGTLVDNGMFMFARMFESYPEMTKLYSFLDDWEGPADQCPSLRPHVKRVFKKLDLVISQLDTPAICIADLKNLGSRHPGYNVNPNKHAQPTGESLLFMLKSRLGPKWTPEVAAAWGKCWKEIVGAMLG